MKCKEFFQVCILPELLGRWYTKSIVVNEEVDKSLPGPSTASDESSDPASTTYCYCQQPERGQMIACDNVNCSIEWSYKVRI